MATTGQLDDMTDNNSTTTEDSCRNTKQDDTEKIDFVLDEQVKDDENDNYQDVKEDEELKGSDDADEYGDEDGFIMPDLDDEDEENDASQSKKVKKSQLVKIPQQIITQVGSAMRDFEMIKDGDKVLVALSGGKDSLSMVHILRYFQSVAPIKFDIGAVTVDP